MPRNMDQFTSEDMTIPELKLIQNVGGEEAKEAGGKPGEIYIPLLDEVLPEGLDVIIVDMQKTRTYWGRENIDDGPPQCSSQNAETNVSLDGKDCSKCEHRCDTPWLLTAIDRRTKCLTNWNMLVIRYDDANNIPLIIRCSGISTKAARELFTQLRMNRRLKQYGMHRGIVHVSSEKKKVAVGEAYAFKFMVKGFVDDPAQAKELLLQSTDMLGTDISDLLPAGVTPEMLPPAIEQPKLTEGKTPEKPQVVIDKKDTKAISKEDLSKLNQAAKSLDKAPLPEPEIDLDLNF